MKPTIQKTKLEEKILALAEGYRSVPEPSLALRFTAESLHPEQVVARLGMTLELFAATRRAEAEHTLAIEACRRALPAARTFVAEASHVARTHFGSDPEKMSAFGLSGAGVRTPSRKRRRCKRGGAEVVTVIEEVIEECPQRRCPRRRHKRGVARS